MSKYLYNIKLRPESREPVVGGMPLATFLSMNTGHDSILGGGQDSLRKISHLSIPVGLVIIKPTSMGNPIVKSVVDHDGNDDDVLPEHIFDKLYRNTTYQTTGKDATSKSRKRHSRKLYRK